MKKFNSNLMLLIDFNYRLQNLFNVKLFCTKHLIVEKLIQSKNLLFFTMALDNNSNSPSLENETNAKCNEAPVITEEMLQEEKMLEEKVALEEENLRQKITEEERKVEEEKCFKRLHLLLSRSSIYAKFMAEKLQVHEEKIRKKERNTNQRNSVIGTDNESVKSGTKRKAGLSSSRKKTKGNINIMDVYKKENMKDIKAHEENSQKELKTFSPDSQPELFYGGTMHDYQIEGFEWLKTLFENGVNGILADEMGLGKTIQCIALIAYLIQMGISGPFYVSAPLSTVPNWCAEFKRFTPDIPVLLYHGHKDERKKLRKKIFEKVKVKNVDCHPVVITSYTVTLIDAKYLADIEWKMLIIDEAHRIKNFECKLIESLKHYNAVHRLLLTGTPLQNNLSELWALLNFILPEIFDDLKIFQSWFDINHLTQIGVTQGIIAQEQEKQIISIMHQILTPFLLRRTKSDSFIYEERREHIPKEAKQRRVELSENTNGLKDIIGKRGTGPKEGRILSKINLKLSNPTMILRKICGHPYLVSYPLDPVTGDYLVDENLVTSSGKLLILDVLLAELKKRGHKILLFSQFTTMLDILEDYCNLRGYGYTCLNGKMTLGEREEEMKAFREDKSKFLFLISTRAGGLGLNLTTADTVILYDSDWNPQCDLQAQDRCHRIGQTKSVVVYRLIVPNTIDERILDFATAKRKLEKVIIQKGRFNSADGLSTLRSAITKKELLELLETPDENGQVNVENFEMPREELANMLDRNTIVTAV
ncbi:hypothetical protein TNCT_105151 [Trichonephila clavata]|uniref:Proliferation-associated SNF2-like protein n=1 Tax=Trichonephila clavata TaxID=2740835 RepID=A0A8X6GBL1_TRICU|nr:hypothetical protein TNCT_105151 [Trichonephila clavata]